MHLLVREIRTLDEQAQADDLGQAPADLVVLSFSDSDLASLSAAHDPEGPSLRLASLGRLRHPMSVDLYAEQTIVGSGCVFVRLLGGLEYWRYGAEELAATCRRHGIPLAMVPGDALDDPRLAALSTVTGPVLSRLDGFLRQGGAANHRAALGLLTHLVGLGMDDGAMPVAVPSAGVHRAAVRDGRPVACIVIYRAHLMAGDLAPFETLAEALEARGLAAEILHVASLKEPEAARFVASHLSRSRPAVVLNATFFSARSGPEAGSPLDAAGVPVIQLLQPVGGETAWQESARGLSQTDLAMQLVLPELDGRLAGAAISFKGTRCGSCLVPRSAACAGPCPAGFAASVNLPHAEGIALVADRAAGWASLGGTPAGRRRVAIVLSDYPAVGGRIAHAVGLDSLASLSAILSALGGTGYETGTLPDQDGLVASLCQAPPAILLTAERYRALFATLPASLRAATVAAWGEPVGDISLRYLVLGRLVVAVQPDRGSALDRKAGYHDPDLPPRHDYLGFHLWLRMVLDVDALVHLGTHGTLEWLPGKASALSAACAPAALLRGVPVIYPFIVNNPGEAAAAKRRLGAVTIGHLTPPIGHAGLHGDGLALERLIDDYAAADGLDRRRGAILRGEILDRAEDCGLLAESGVKRGEADESEALARLDAYLCDVKELQIRDGLHVFGQSPPSDGALLTGILRASPNADPAHAASMLAASGASEMRALLDALDGRFVQPGPSGAPSRGRLDVLPTGRNLFSVDPRAIPTQAAMVLAEKTATILLDRHRQEQGDWLRTVVIDLWGSTSLRTGGEDLGLALLLMGVKPVWDQGSGRVSGIEIVPLAVLDRPRVDVTLRISGFFRDGFPGQIALFDQAVSAIAAREAEGDWNPLAAAMDGAADASPPTRIFGPASGCYGTGIEDRLARDDWTDRASLGQAYLDGASFAYGNGRDGVRDRQGFADRVAGAEALVHVQDHAEIDLLDGIDVAAHEGGFAAAAGSLGGTPVLYHADTSTPDVPRLRLAAEEVARVVRGRAANPDWIAGMRRHGYRGAAEIAGGLDALHGFAALLPERFDAQFELVFAATLGDPETDRFLRAANPEARRAMQARFDEARRRDLWRPRRNDL